MIIPAISMHKEYYNKFKSEIFKQKINMHPTVIFMFTVVSNEGK